MKLEIVQNGRVLAQYHHGGRQFVEAPPSGDYVLRLSNPTSSRKLAVVSVDGRNVVSGEKAGFDGPGYVLRAWETIEIPGWRRSDSEVAKFEFQPQDKSYAAAVGDGTSNTGVIGVASFEEKARLTDLWESVTFSSNTTSPVFGARSWGDDSDDSDEWDEVSDMTTLSSQVPSASATKSKSLGSKRARSPLRSRAAVDLGTGYGGRAVMHTTETSFERAATVPSQVITLQYAVRQRLVEWGVPVAPEIPFPNAFPQSQTPSVKAPPGWRG